MKKFFEEKDMGIPAVPVPSDKPHNSA